MILTIDKHSLVHRKVPGYIFKNCMEIACRRTTRGLHFSAKDYTENRGYHWTTKLRRLANDESVTEDCPKDHVLVCWWYKNFENRPSFDYVRIIHRPKWTPGSETSMEVFTCT